MPTHPVPYDILSPSVAPSALIENVQTREVGRASELPTWRPHLNPITVSKKRNWLQQSSLGRSHPTKEEPPGLLGAEEEQQQPPPPPSPSPEHLRPSGGAPSRPARLHLPQVRHTHTSAQLSVTLVTPKNICFGIKIFFSLQFNFLLQHKHPYEMKRDSVSEVVQWFCSVLNKGGRDR